MGDLKQISIGCFLPLALLGLIFYTGMTIHYNGKWRAVFPEDIHTGRHLARETDWLGSPGGGCGGVIFKLKKETSSQLKISGLNFLKDKTQPRSLKSEITWSLANKEDIPGIKWRLQCVTSDNFDAKIEIAVEARNAFYGKTASYNEIILLLLPDEKVAFAGYWD